MKMDRMECESLGKVWVEGFKKDDGTYVHGYCKDVPAASSREWLAPSFEDFMGIEKQDEKMPALRGSTDDPLASKNVKLPKSNTRNARKTYGEIKNDEKHLGRDLRTQDFEDAVIQSERIGQASEKEMSESDKLSASQMIKAQEMYAEQKRKIAKREYRETRKRISSEAKATKRQIKSESKRIKHEKKQARREQKLERLKEK